MTFQKLALVNLWNENTREKNDDPIPKKTTKYQEQTEGNIPAGNNSYYFLKYQEMKGCCFISLFTNVNILLNN